MRLVSCFVLLISWALLSRATAQLTPPAPDSTAGSLLAPRTSEARPPMPMAPDASGVPEMPRALPPFETSPAASDQGTIIAVPLPPPGSAPVPAPVPVVTAPPMVTPPDGPIGPQIGSAAGATAAAPIALTPIPLTLPPLAPSAATAKPGVPGAKSSIPPTIAAKLPTPPLSPAASPADFLRAARGALAAGRDGEARSALEMAQTRLLDRWVDAGQETYESNLAVTQISEAMGALAANDRMTCLRYIEFASQTIGSPLD